MEEEDVEEIKEKLEKIDREILLGMGFIITALCSTEKQAERIKEEYVNAIFEEDTPDLGGL